MPCPVCETLPDRPAATMDLWLWAPLGHSAGRILSMPGGGDRFRHDDDTGALTARVAEADLTDLMTRLGDRLTGQEAEDTKALLLPAGTTVGARDIPNVQSLAQAIARSQSGWLLALLREERLFSHYHAIVEAADPSRIFAHEGLVRGRDGDGGVISGGAIMAAARDSGLLFQTDLAARTRAVEGFAAARPPGKLFINFSPTAIYDPAFCLRTTFARIQDLGLAPSDIVFEVIESERHRDLAHLLSILKTYRQEGFKVALDDYGAGYSTTEILHALSPDFVKLDMTLVRGVADSDRKAVILDTVASMCHRLDIPVIAEGVETEADRARVVETGVPYLQGYLFGRPGPLPAPAA